MTEVRQYNRRSRQISALGTFAQTTDQCRVGGSFLAVKDCELAGANLARFRSGEDVDLHS